MKRLFILLGTLLLVVSSCEEGDGFESGIEKTVEVELELNTNDILNNNGIIDLARQHDIIKTDFTEYLGQVTRVDIHFADIQISGLNENAFAQSLIRAVDLDVRSVDDETETFDFASIENIPYNTSAAIPVYSADSLQSQRLLNAINFIGTQIVQNRPFIWDVGGAIERAPADQRIVIKVSLDVTVTVELL